MRNANRAYFRTAVALSLGLSAFGSSAQKSVATIMRTPQWQTSNGIDSTTNKVAMGWSTMWPSAGSAVQVSLVANTDVNDLMNIASIGSRENADFIYWLGGSPTWRFGPGILGANSEHSFGISDFYASSTGTPRFIIVANGNVGIGLTNPSYTLDVQGTAHVGLDLTVDGNIAAPYQDVAEWVASSEGLTPGTVVVVDVTRNNGVVASSRVYDTHVAGVVSARPGIALGHADAGKYQIATVGRVRVKADATSAPISVGDLLVTGNTAGMAMRSSPVSLSGIEMHRPGTLLGKALEPLSEGKGEILVLLSLQ